MSGQVLLWVLWSSADSQAAYSRHAFRWAVSVRRCYRFTFPIPLPHPANIDTGIEQGPTPEHYGVVAKRVIAWLEKLSAQKRAEESPGHGRLPCQAPRERTSTGGRWHNSGQRVLKRKSLKSTSPGGERSKQGRSSGVPLKRAGLLPTAKTAKHDLPPCTRLCSVQSTTFQSAPIKL